MARAALRGRASAAAIRSGEDEERFLSAQTDTFAGANVKEKASVCFV